jgi:GGDEF domain-containing protein
LVLNSFRLRASSNSMSNASTLTPTSTSPQLLQEPHPLLCPDQESMTQSFHPQPLRQGFEIMERLRDQLSKLRIEFTGQLIHITMSVGVTSFFLPRAMFLQEM